MNVSLKDFVASGAFGLIEVGMGRTEVEEILGAPESWEDGAEPYHEADIWKYGDVKFYFQGEPLWMIFLDGFDIPSGGRDLLLDSWIISGGLTRAQAEAHLEAEGITFHLKPFPYNDNGVHLVAASGTVLAFSGRDADAANLHSIHRRQKL